MAEPGKVFLVGAGPGDPELITVRGRSCLRGADVIVHDRLVSRRLLDLASPVARRIAVGKAPGHHPWPQRRINRLLVAEARRGRNVVRLKGGDPFVFGRGGEECQVLAAAGVSYEVVPGVSSAVASPAFAGIPLTHREHSSAVAIVTGHTCGSETAALDWRWLAGAETLVVLMGLRHLGLIAAKLVEHGRAHDTPIVVVSNGTRRDQRVVRGCLTDIAERARDLPSPATIVVGKVVDLAARLHWFKGERGVADRDGRPADRQGEGVA